MQNDFGNNVRQNNRSSYFNNGGNSGQGGGGFRRPSYQGGGRPGGGAPQRNSSSSYNSRSSGGGTFKIIIIVLLVLAIVIGSVLGAGFGLGWFSRSDTTPTVNTIRNNNVTGIVAMGSNLAISVDVEGSNLNANALEWISSNTDVATVAAGSTVSSVPGSALSRFSANVSGHSEGTATVTVRSSQDPNVSSVTTLTVFDPNAPTVDSIHLNHDVGNVNIGGVFTLVANISGLNVGSNAIQWSSSNTAVATVAGVSSSNNLYTANVTGMVAGTADITARSSINNSIAATARITVTTQPSTVTRIELNISDQTISQGTRINIIATVIGTGPFNNSLTWASSNPNVATISPDGNVEASVQAVAGGTTRITATSVQSNHVNAAVTLTVGAAGEASRIEGTSEDVLRTLLSRQEFERMFPRRFGSAGWRQHPPRYANVLNPEGTATVNARLYTEEEIAAAPDYFSYDNLIEAVRRITSLQRIVEMRRFPDNFADWFGPDDPIWTVNGGTRPMPNPWGGFAPSPLAGTTIAWASRESVRNGDTGTTTEMFETQFHSNQYHNQGMNTGTLNDAGNPVWPELQQALPGHTGWPGWAQWPIVTDVFDYGGFLTSGTGNDQRRELAAFLAQMAHEVGVNNLYGGFDNMQGGLYFNEELRWKTGNGSVHNRYYHVDLDFFGGEESTLALNLDMFPPQPGMSYHGRGGIQLSWSSNYARFSALVFNGDRMELLRRPERVSADGVLGYMASIWFWMNDDVLRPSMHTLMTTRWTHTTDPRFTHGTASLDRSEFAHYADFREGFGASIMVLNGAHERNLTHDANNLQRRDRRVWRRVEFYLTFLDMFGATTSPNEQLDTLGMNPWIPSSNFENVFAYAPSNPTWWD